MRRGEVFWADLSPRSGAEQRGRRPVIVVSNDGFNLTPSWQSVIVVPISSSETQARRGPTAVPLPAGSAGLRRPSVALCHQVTTLDRAKVHSCCPPGADQERDRLGGSEHSVGTGRHVDGRRREQPEQRRLLGERPAGHPRADAVGGPPAGRHRPVTEVVVQPLGEAFHRGGGRAVEERGPGVVPRIETDPDRVRPAASEVERLVADPALARELLGWTPSVDLRAGLQRTVEWLRESPSGDRAAEYVR